MTSAQAHQYPPLPLGLGDVISHGLAVLRRRPGMFLALSAIPAAVAVLVTVVAVVGLSSLWPQLVISAGMMDPGPVLQAMAAWITVAVLGSLVAGLVQLYALGLLAVLTRETLDNRRPDFATLRAVARGSFTRLLLLALLGMVAYVALIAIVMAPMFLSLATAGPGTSRDAVAASALLSMLLLFLAMPVVTFVVVRLAYLLPVVSLGGLGGMAALRRAWQLTRGVF